MLPEDIWNEDKLNKINKFIELHKTNEQLKDKMFKNSSKGIIKSLKNIQ